MTPTLPEPGAVNEFERRAVAARYPMGIEGRREPSALKPFRIEQPGIHNYPLSRPPTPVSETYPI